MSDDYSIGPDGVAEEEAILSRLRAFLVGGRVYDQIPDEFQAPNGDIREVAPYILVDFGTPYPTNRDRIVGAGELEQPYAMAISVQCWGSEMADVRRIAGAVRRLLLDWQPTSTCYPLSGAGGGGFVTPGRPTVPSRAMRQVLFTLTFNVGSTDGLIVIPPDGGTGGSMPADAVEDLIEAALAALPPVAQRFDFPVPVSEWTMEYALPGIPSVATYSTTGERLFTDEDVTGTTVTVTWAEPTAGFAILS